MGLPMLNRPPKASQSNEESPNKPPSENSNTNAQAAPHSASSSASSSSTGVDDAALRWERLHSLRNRLVDRMYRLEMDEMYNPHRSQNNGNGEHAQITPTNRPVSGMASSRPVPIPSARLVAPYGPAEAILQSWGSLSRSSAAGAEAPARTETERPSERQARRESRRFLARRLAAAEDREEALITLDEFLRESRNPTSDNDEATRTSPHSQRSSSIPPINRLPSSNLYPAIHRFRWENRHRGDTNPAPSQEGRLDIIRATGDGVPIATWLAQRNIPIENSASPHDTFDSFISHIRRIGNIQDAMLATIRSGNSSLASSATSSSSTGDSSINNSIENQSNIPVPNTTARTTASRAANATPRSMVASATRPEVSTTDTGTAVTRSITPTPSAELRLRAMQARIDSLTNEFSLLRSTWAQSHAENQGYERSLRRLQELLPHARRADRARRTNRGGEVSLLYEDLHADAAAREGELFPRSPWGDSEAERIRERMRMAAATAWGLERENQTRTENPESATEGSDGSQVATPVAETAQPFSPAERNSQKEMLAAKMAELTLKGIR